MIDLGRRAAKYRSGALGGTRALSINVQRWIVCAALLLSACNRSGDYLAVAGGGFVFNYRIAEATYGIALKPMREIPADAVIEARFDNPVGGAPFVVRKAGPFNPTRITLATPPLAGVEKGKPYKAVVVLSDGDGETLQKIEKTFVSDLDQSVLPERPLAIGPGYQKNLDGSTTAYPESINRTPPKP
jgi:hypothetical protein